MGWPEWYVIGAIITAWCMLFHTATPKQSWPVIIVSLFLWPITLFLMIGGAVERWWKRR